MSQLIVRRQKALWRDKIRDYKVILDGERVAQVSNGAEVSISASPGAHKLHISIDWCRSNAIDFVMADGEQKIVECGPNGNALLAVLYVTVLFRRYIWLRSA